jgi:site-specific recombinase XerD
VGKSVIVRRGKGGKPRTVLLTPETQKMLKEFIRLKRTLREAIDSEDFLFVSERKKPFTTNGIRKRVKHWFSRLGFNPKLSVHSCRHSYVSALFRAGLDLPTIMAQAGHSSVAVTNIYSHATREDLEGFSLFSFENTKNSKLIEDEK